MIIYPVDLGNVCQTLKLQLARFGLLELDEDSKTIDYHVVLC